MSRRYATEKTLCQSKIGQGLSALIGASAIGAASAVFTGELLSVLVVVAVAFKLSTIKLFEVDY